MTGKRMIKELDEISQDRISSRRGTKCASDRLIIFVGVTKGDYITPGESLMMILMLLFLMVSSSYQGTSKFLAPTIALTLVHLL